MERSQSSSNEDQGFRMYLLGGFDLYWGSKRLPGFPTQKARSLFAFLVLNRDRMHRRELLASTFWAESSDVSAKRCLRTEIWRVRKFLEMVGVNAETYITTQGDEVRFSAGGPCWSDVSEFESKLESMASMPEEDWSRSQSQAVQRAVDLYGGDLLAGQFDDWCLHERERLRLLFLSSLESLMKYYQRVKSWDQAVASGWRLLREDSLLEQVHRSLMRSYCRMGNRPSALRQYESCVRLLQTELDVEPMEETKALYQRIKASGRDDDPSLTSWSHVTALSRVRGSAQEINDALSELDAAESRLEQARNRLAKAIAGVPGA